MQQTIEQPIEAKKPQVGNTGGGSSLGVKFLKSLQMHIKAQITDRWDRRIASIRARPTDTKRRLSARIGGWGAACFVALTALAFLIEEPQRTTALAILAGSWAFVPPMWFLFEFHAFRPADHECQTPQIVTQAAEKTTYEGGETTYVFERFKYNQELARNLWAGIAAILAGLYLKGMN